MKRGPADLGPVGAQCPSGSVGSRGLLSPRAVGPLVEKTGSWAIAPRPVVSAPSLPTGPRARHLNPLNLTFLPVRHRHLLPLGAISQMRNVTLETDPEESSTLPRVTQLTTAESGIEPWCLVHGSRCRGSAGWRPEWPRGMPPRWDVCPEAPASWPARWKCGPFTDCSLSGWGQSGAGSVCSVLGFKGWKTGDWCGGPATSPELSDVASSPSFWEVVCVRGTHTFLTGFPRKWGLLEFPVGGTILVGRNHQRRAHRMAGFHRGGCRKRWEKKILRFVRLLLEREVKNPFSI